MKKKLQVLQKAVKQAGTKKKIKKNTPSVPIAQEQQVPDHLDEDIDSDFLDENSANDNQQKAIQFDLDESEENEKVRENADDKRLRLAKRILSDTREVVKQGLASRGPQDDEGFRGVEMNDEERKINEALQNQIVNFIFQLIIFLSQVRNTSYFQKQLIG